MLWKAWFLFFRKIDVIVARFHWQGGYWNDSSFSMSFVLSGESHPYFSFLRHAYICTCKYKFLSIVVFCILHIVVRCSYYNLKSEFFYLITNNEPISSMAKQGFYRFCIWAMGSYWTVNFIGSDILILLWCYSNGISNWKRLGSMWWSCSKFLWWTGELLQFQFDSFHDIFGSIN